MWLEQRFKKFIRYLNHLSQTAFKTEIAGPVPKFLTQWVWTALPS